MKEETSLVPYSRPSALTPRGFFSVVFRRRKLIALSFVGVLAGVILAILALPDQYQAEAKIMVERARFDPVVTPDTGSHQTAQITPPTPQDVNSEVDLLQSEDLLHNVVLACNLQDGLSWWRRKLPKFAQHVFWPSRDVRIGLAVQALQNNLTILPPNQSNLIKLTYTNSDPKMAAKVLNTLGELYMKKHLEVHRPDGTYSFFEKEVERYRNALNDVQARLVEFGRKEKVVVADQEKTNLLQRLADFDANLQSTQAAISETEHRIDELQQLAKQTSPRRTTQVRTSAVLLEQLRSTLFTLNLKRTQLLTKYEPSYRSVQDVDKEIVETQAAIARVEKAPTIEQTTDGDPTFDWLSSELAKSRSELAGLRARANQTQHIVALYKQRGRELDEKGIMQQDLLRSAKLAEDNYLTAVRKQEEARMSDQLDRSRIVNVAIAERPNVPAVPLVTFLMKLALGAVLSLMVSMGLAFTADYLDTSFRTPDELEGFLGVPVLAAVPKHKELGAA